MPDKNLEDVFQENELLKARLAETEATLEAIRNGEVDAIVVSGINGEKVFTLTSAETPYRIIIEEMEEGAVTVSEDGIILFCNRRFSQMLGQPMSQIVGKKYAEFFGECDQEKFDAMLREAIKGRIKDEITRLDKYGEIFYLHISMCALPEGMLGKVCIIVSDITELKKHQHNLESMVKERTTQINRANVELAELNTTKDKLFSIIAHDLRGPFTSLLGFTDLLIENLENYDRPKFEQIVGHISRSAKNAYSLLENLLLWARSQNKQLLFTPRTTNLFGVTRDVILSLTSVGSIKNIKLVNKVPANLSVYADINMLTAILRNLISNAVKFSNSGGAVEIEAFSFENAVEIAVKDNGIGMNEEIKNKLFKTVNNVTRAGTANEKGTGLGLMICKDFIDKHEGNIWVESEPGNGTRFIFSLPNPVHSVLN
jgi:PAS domain S-box-containing protein